MLSYSWIFDGGARGTIPWKNGVQVWAVLQSLKNLQISRPLIGTKIQFTRLQFVIIYFTKVPKSQIWQWSVHNPLYTKKQAEAPPPTIYSRSVRAWGDHDQQLWSAIVRKSE